MDTNIFQRIQEIFGKMSENFSILEEQIEIDVQISYFEFASKLKTGSNKEELINQQYLLLEETTPLEKKRELLVQLAGIEQVEVFRTLEKYASNPDEELKQWSVLALRESRALLESSLLDESKVFISTGLGGKGNKLRYFVLMVSGMDDEYSDAHKQLIKIELEDNFKKFKCDIEQINFHENLITLVILIPMNVSIKDAFRKGIECSNQYGNLLRKNFIVSNIKIWSIEEIKSQHQFSSFLEGNDDDSDE